MTTMTLTIGGIAQPLSDFVFGFVGEGSPKLRPFVAPWHRWESGLTLSCSIPGAHGSPVRGAENVVEK